MKFIQETELEIITTPLSLLSSLLSSGEVLSQKEHCYPTASQSQDQVEPLQFTGLGRPAVHHGL